MSLPFPQEFSSFSLSRNFILALYLYVIIIFITGRFLKVLMLDFMSSEEWTKQHLYESDRAGILDEEEWINDNHVSDAQTLLKQQFPYINGFESMLKNELSSICMNRIEQEY